jgi:RimJ/RimL family protein N-acetyltransferase
MQPTLLTVRLALDPAGADDLDALWALWTDPDVRRYLWDDRVVARHEAEAVLADCAGLAPGGLGLWMLRPRRDGGARPAALGCAGLLPVGAIAAAEPRLAGLVEPVVALAPAAWGRGYAAEALGALLGHATGALGLARVAGFTDAPNAASDRMLRRAGFRPLGEVPGPRHRIRTYLYGPDDAPDGGPGRPPGAGA